MATTNKPSRVMSAIGSVYAATATPFIALATVPYYFVKNFALNLGQAAIALLNPRKFYEVDSLFYSYRFNEAYPNSSRVTLLQRVRFFGYKLLMAAVSPLTALFNAFIYTESKFGGREYLATTIDDESTFVGYNNNLFGIFRQTHDALMKHTYALGVVTAAIIVGLTAGLLIAFPPAGVVAAAIGVGSSTVGSTLGLSMLSLPVYATILSALAAAATSVVGALAYGIHKMTQAIKDYYITDENTDSADLTEVKSEDTESKQEAAAEREARREIRRLTERMKKVANGTEQGQALDTEVKDNAGTIAAEFATGKKGQVQSFFVANTTSSHLVETETLAQPLEDTVDEERHIRYV